MAFNHHFYIIIWWYPNYWIVKRQHIIFIYKTYTFNSIFSSCILNMRSTSLQWRYFLFMVKLCDHAFEIIFYARAITGIVVIAKVLIMHKRFNKKCMLHLQKMSYIYSNAYVTYLSCKIKFGCNFDNNGSAQYVKIYISSQMLKNIFGLHRNIYHKSVWYLYICLILIALKLS